MKSHYNAFNSKYNLDTSTSSDKDYHEHEKQSSKLYSSERLTHADLPSHSGNAHPPVEVSATQLYFNLNNSLDGLLSKIESIKEEHTTEQKVPKQMKKLNMDVSGFPMPNLSNNQYISGKPLMAPIFVKPRQKRHHQQQLSIPSKLSPFLSEDSKSVSPPSNYNRSMSTKIIPYDNEAKIQVQVHETHSTQSIHQEQDRQRTFNKQTLSKGLMSMPNINLKVSMEMSSEQYHQRQNENGNWNQGTLELDKIIEKEAQETDIVKKSIIFGEKVSLKDFELGKNIGSGKFGDVHICRHRATGAMFALKKIFKSTILEYNMITQFTRQLKIHYQLDHPNIIKLYTHFSDEYHIFLIMQYAQSGILLDKLKCSQDQASKYIDQTIDALLYLHKLKIAHRDIKPQNIVLQFNDVIKLCDFGWASFYENQMKTTFCGTLDYLSPEMREGGQYDNSVDIWSVGVLTYELLTGNPPYRKELMLAMKNGVGPSKPGARKVNWSVNYPAYISPLAESFIRNLLKQNPEERATLRFCSTHTFIKKYKEALEELPLYYEFCFVLGEQAGNGSGKGKGMGEGGFLGTDWTPRSGGGFGYGFGGLDM